MNKIIGNIDYTDRIIKFVYMIVALTIIRRFYLKYSIRIINFWSMWILH